MLATVIDLTALWQIALVAVCGGIGVTAAFGLAVLRGEALADRRSRGEPLGLRGAADLAVVAAVGVLCVAAVVVGVLAMTHK